MKEIELLKFEVKNQTKPNILRSIWFSFRRSVSIQFNVFFSPQPNCQFVFALNPKLINFVFILSFKSNLFLKLIEINLDLMLKRIECI